MIDTELLKEKVLDLAMRGKLVEQDPTDGHARDLLREIQAEREQLVKDKKIKKSKPLPPISEEEIPYEIPESWEWVRLGDILIEHIGGGTPSKKIPEYWDGNIPWCSIKDFHGSILTTTKDTITEEGLSNSSSNLIQSGNLIVATRLAVGKIMLADIDIAINQDLRALIFGTSVNKSYIQYIYGKLKFVTQGVTVKGININNLLSILLPFPPSNEQERISDQISYLFKLIDHLADQQVKFNYYKKLVQDKALELAMQGKLVPQLPEEGTAASLLEEVAAERQRLIDEKKIKKTKPLPEISEEEIPYEIPESWEWVRLGSIGVVTSGGTPNTSVEDYWKDAHIPWITPAAMSDNNKMYFDELSNMRYINELGYQNSSAKLIKKKSIIYSSRAPIGYINIVPFDYTTNQGCKSLSTFQQVNVEYVYYSIMSRKEEIIRSGSGSTFKEISGTKFSNITIPLPPVKEQERIVNKLDEIDQALFSEH